MKKAFMIIIISFVTLIANQSPTIPDSIITQVFGDTTKEIDFSVQTTDPEHDKISYQFDWGDRTISDWSEYTTSGYVFSKNHLYQNVGQFLCRVRVKDEASNVSDWSKVCTLTIKPKLLKWAYETNSGIYSGCAIGPSNEIYATSENGILYSLNSDGTLRWQFSTLSSIYSNPVIGKNGIYITSTDGKLFSIDFSGKERWRLQIGAAIYSSPAISKDAIYFGCDDDNLYSVSLSGKLLWKYKTGDEIAGSPSIGKDGTIYVASDAIYALSPKGKNNWTFKPPDEYETYFFASPIINSDGSIYIGGTDGAMYVLTNQGRLKWRTETPDQDAIRAAAAIDQKGVIYFGAEDGILYKKDFYGEISQLFETDYYIFSAPAIDTLANIYFVSDDGFFYCINKNGKLLFKWMIAEDNKEMMYSSSPIITSDGTVYVGSWEGKLLAFDGFAPPTKSSWPMFRCNQQNTANLKSEK